MKCTHNSALSVVFNHNKKAFRTFNNTFTVSLKSYVFLTDFIEKKFFCRDTCLIKYQYFDRVEVKEGYPMEHLLNRQKINQ